MKGAWRGLPSAICADGQLAAGHGEQCWNGRGVGEYRRPVVGDGVALQRRNPEFQHLNLTKGEFTIQ